MLMDTKLYNIVQTMKKEGKSIEEIAKELNKEIWIIKSLYQ